MVFALEFLDNTLLTGSCFCHFPRHRIGEGWRRVFDQSQFHFQWKNRRFVFPLSPTIGIPPESNGAKAGGDVPVRRFPVFSSILAALPLNDLGDRFGVVRLELIERPLQKHSHQFFASSLQFPLKPKRGLGRKFLQVKTYDHFADKSLLLVEQLRNVPVYFGDDARSGDQAECGLNHGLPFPMSQFW